VSTTIARKSDEALGFVQNGMKIGKEPSAQIVFCGDCFMIEGVLHFSSLLRRVLQEVFDARQLEPFASK
jgi:hypothetical protein